MINAFLATFLADRADRRADHSAWFRYLNAVARREAGGAA